MMKFRLWSEEKGKWLEPGCGTHCYHFYAITPEGEVLYFVGALSNEEVTCEKVKATIHRGTGILDKNGIEIFEGDIVRSFLTHEPNNRYFRPHNRVIKFIKSELNIREHNLHCFEQTYEIIGNIFENPELLK